MRRVRLPKKTMATKMPTKMVRKVSQSRDMPNMPDTPPNPMMAEVDTKVAP